MRPLLEQMAVAYATEIEALKVEIDRLTDALKTCRELRQYDRAAIVEQCVRVARDWLDQRTNKDLIDLLRALKSL